MKKIRFVLAMVLLAAIVLSGAPICALAAKAVDPAAAKYAAIIDAYRDYLIHRDDSDNEEALEKLLAKIALELNIKPDILNNAKASDLWGSFEPFVYDPNVKLGYSLRDLNNDGIPELFILSEDYSIHAIFSLIKDSPVLVGAYWSRKNCVIDKAGTLYIDGSSGADDSNSASYLFISGDKELQLVEMVGTESVDKQTGKTFPKPRNYRIKNGKKTIIDDKEAGEAWRSFHAVVSSNPTKDAGLVFIPIRKDN